MALCMGQVNAVDRIHVMHYTISSMDDMEKMMVAFLMTCQVRLK